MVANGRSTLNERDLLRITLTCWTPFVSLTKTPLEEARRSAAPARSAEPNKASAAPRTSTLKPRSPPALLETRPPLIIPFPFPAIRRCPRNVRLRRPNNSPLRTTSQSLQSAHDKIVTLKFDTKLK